MRLLSAFLPLRLKGGSPNSHRAIGNAMRRWLARLRASSALIATAARDGAWYDAQGFAARGGAAAIATTEGASAKTGAAVAARAASVEAHRAYSARVGVWVDRFTRLLLGSLYPGSPFERSMLALKLYDIHIATWAPDGAVAAAAITGSADNKTASAARGGELLSLTSNGVPKGLLAAPALDPFGEEAASRLLQLLLQDLDPVHMLMQPLCMRHDSCPYIRPRPCAYTVRSGRKATAHALHTHLHTGAHRGLRATPPLPSRRTAGFRHRPLRGAARALGAAAPRLAARVRERRGCLCAAAGLAAVRRRSCPRATTA